MRWSLAFLSTVSITLAILLLAPGMVPPAFAPHVSTFDQQITVNTDDGYSHAPIIGFDINKIRVGNLSSFGDPLEDAWIRFTSVPIPNGAEIRVAHLIVQARLTDRDGPNTRTNLSMNDVDSAVAPVSQADHASKARTAQVVSWDDENFVPDVNTTSPDFSIVLQTIVNRPGWVSGADMMVLWDDNLSALNKQYDINDFNDDNARAPRIHVEYFVNTAPVISDPISVDQGRTFTSYSRTVVAVDPDHSQTLTWTLVSNASFLSITGTNRSGTVSGITGVVGVFFVNVSVEDNAPTGSLSDSMNYTLVFLAQGVLNDSETLTIWLFSILLLVLFVVGPIFRMWFLWMLAGIDGILFGLFVFSTLGTFPLAIIIMGFGGFLMVGGILLTISQAVRGAIAGREV